MTSIKAYLSYQHKYDSQLKFKQVDLEKGIVDLFVDVPASAIGPADPRARDHWRERFQRGVVLAALADEGHRRPGHDEEEDRIGAVRALVDKTVARALPRVVIEGAPGQGKSTITQFLCQLHRMTLLKKNWELSKVPESLRPSDVRLPIRIDLRDYATWLAGKSPFNDSAISIAGNEFSPALESFIAAQITAQSGGTQFTPSDLLAVASSSALLIVLDGFDEVADVPTRNRLVKEVSDAATRLEGNAISFQIVVTSRPAAFANSPGFSREEWQHIQILPLNKSAILIYTDKWISGHGLDQRGRREITNVLEEKLEYPHVRDLARNPMQLAILLALISNQGTSLPDKRTVLYDRYIDIFFNRESEKSKVVRDKRDILIDMHRYLAWTLQVEAESDAKAGNITEKRLREVLRSFLVDVGHDPSIIDDLFVGMVERVVALVSRVQGTFEFEVQPLREYFAARYLYDTAPYVQAGSSRSGSIMDRFDALARNAYWLNVTRFYCGCYSTGELSSLVDGLINIGQSKKYSDTYYIGDLSFTLIGDYVFSAQPKVVSRLLDFLLSPARFRLLLAEKYTQHDEEEFPLPEGPARERLFDLAHGIYANARTVDVAYSSASLMRTNGADKDLLKIWRSAKDNLPQKDALNFGGFLEIFDEIGTEELIRAAEEAGPAALRTCLYRDRTDIFVGRPDLWRALIDVGLDGRASLMAYHRSNSETMDRSELNVRMFFSILWSLAGLETDDHVRGHTFADFANRYSMYSMGIQCLIDETSSVDRNESPIPIEVLEACNKLATLEMLRTTEIANAFSQFFDVLLKFFGERALIVEAMIAVVDWLRAAETPVKFENSMILVNSLAEHSEDCDFWTEKTKRLIQCPTNRMLIIRALIQWAGADVINCVIEDVSLVVDDLSSDDFHALYTISSGRSSAYSGGGEELEINISRALAKNVVGCRLASVLSRTCNSQSRDILFEEVLSTYNSEDRDILEAKCLIQKFLKRSNILQFCA